MPYVFDNKMKIFRQGQACGRRPHDEGTSNCFTCYCYVERDHQNSFDGCCPQRSWGKVRWYINVQEPVTKMVWATLGTEFGMDTCKTAVVVRALFGLKSAGSTFRGHFARCMESICLSPVRQTQICAWNQKLDLKMSNSITLIYCVLWMTFFAYSQSDCVLQCLC